MDGGLVDPAWETPEELTLKASFAALPDPAGWSEDHVTGLLFRRATGAELERHRWNPGTFLVETGGLSALREGTSEASFLMPLYDGVAEPLRFVRVGARSGDVYYSTGAGLPGTALPADEESVPTFYDYAVEARRAPLGATGSLVADSEGGFHGQVVFLGLRATVESNEAWWDLDPIRGPRDEVPDPRSVALATLGPAPVVPVPENWGDAVTNYNYDEMGEIKWCTRYLSSWKAKIDTLHTQIVAGFNTNAGGTDAHLGRVHDHCWTASSQSAANACANNGGCTDSNGHNYPYNGDGSVPENYRLDVWDDVAHSHLHYTFATASIAHVLHDGILTGSLCGLSKFPDNNPPTAANGGSVAAGLPLPSGCKDFVSTHEIGHSFNAVHDNTAYGTCSGGGTAISVMGQSGYQGASCRKNDFRTPAKNAIAACVLLSTCPRTGTA